MDDPPASLLDQLDTKPSAIQACSKFIVRHQHLHDAICPKLAQAHGCDAVFERTSKYCRTGMQKKMRESALVLCLERILFRLAQKLDGDAQKNPNLRAVFDFWTKWGVHYATPVETQADAVQVDAMAKIDATFAILEREVSRLSNASSSPMKPSAPSEVVAFMRKKTPYSARTVGHLSRTTFRAISCKKHIGKHAQREHPRRHENDRRTVWNVSLSTVVTRGSNPLSPTARGPCGWISTSRSRSSAGKTCVAGHVSQGTDRGRGKRARVVEGRVLERAHFERS
ncbi:hypothetical protein PsorP6_000822 [Peronosclerospora sorghi]|uniref:Uncharacterized protein n=1 Tax=Peronosclerospora sorghi TaxID=230839 RepID=A0ACC0WQJ8_9STRA|nr:hypothetical protein PsorP6_000822 [Peronosclerospora sorghi]